MLRALVFLATISTAGPHADGAPSAVRIVPGTRVRVSSAMLTRSPVEGTALAFLQDTLVFRPGPRESDATDLGSRTQEPVLRDSVLRVPAGLLERLQVHRETGERAARGAKIGSVVIGLLGLGLGAMIASDPFLGRSTNASAILMLGAAGGITGAATGALIGAVPVTGNWVTLTPAQVRATFTRAAADSAAARRAAH